MGLNQDLESLVNEAEVGGRAPGAHCYGAEGSNGETVMQDRKDS